MEAPSSICRVLGFVALLGGCDRVFGLEPVVARDGSTGSDADGGTGLCFEPRVQITGVTGFDPTLSADKRELIFVDKPNGDYDLFIATRDDAQASTPFANETAITQFNTTFDETDASLTEDGLVVVFKSNRSGAARAYQSERANRAVAFLTPVMVPGLESTAINGLDISPDGLTLYFDDNVSFAAASRTSRAAPFGNIQRFSLDHAAYPSVSPDGLELYYNAAGIVRRTRASTSDPFDGGTAAVVDDGGSDADLTSDGSTLIFRGGTTFFTRERCH